MSEENQHAITIIWDLDGTLVDTAPGVISTYMYLIKNQYLPARSAEKLQRLIGPTLQSALSKEFGLNVEQTQEMVERFREYYQDKAIYCANPYPKIGEVVEIFRRKGFTQVLVTNKREDLAKKLCAYYSFNQYFKIIIGGDPYGLKTKSKLIGECLQQLGTRNVIMIGDTEGDKQAASENGVKFLGVNYGYGFRNVSGYANSPEEISELLESLV